MLYARLYCFIQPSDFDFTSAVNTLVYVIVGGSFIFLGSLIGALIITVLPEILRFLQGAPNGSRDIVQGVILLLVILFLPGGLVELPGLPRRLVRTLSSHRSTTARLEHSARRRKMLSARRTISRGALPAATADVGERGTRRADSRQHPCHCWSCAT